MGLTLNYAQYLEEFNLTDTLANRQIINKNFKHLKLQQELFTLSQIYSNLYTYDLTGLDDGALPSKLNYPPPARTLTFHMIQEDQQHRSLYFERKYKCILIMKDIDKTDLREFRKSFHYFLNKMISKDPYGCQDQLHDREGYIWFSHGDMSLNLTWFLKLKYPSFSEVADQLRELNM